MSCKGAVRERLSKPVAANHRNPVGKPPMRVAFIVSHPIQYYCRLTNGWRKRDDIAIKVSSLGTPGATPVRPWLPNIGEVGPYL